MAARGAAQILRERTGNEATDTRIAIMDESSRSLAEHIIQAVGDRFERRLTEEISRLDRRLTEEVSAVRVEMHKGFGESRSEMHKGFGELRVEIASSKESALRWAFVFWVSQVGAIGGLLAYLK